MSTERSTTPYDVAILGTGLGGTIIGAILARHGARVVLIDASTHPRFAVGESTIPYTSILMRVVSARYDVPELKHLASFDGIRKHITKSCGIKRNFGFVYHRPGERQDPTEVNQFVIPGRLNAENHYFRQDIDAYMLAVAVGYGAVARQQTKINEIDIKSDGVVLVTDRGEEIRARYVVDASGHQSVLAKKFGVREEPARFKHHARSVFTHMIGVIPYDDLAPTPPKGFKNPSRWHQGTLHHLFEGGWLWVIPFDNYRGAQNPLCSVGLTVDPRVHPRPANVSPEEEFREFVSRFPDIEPQFRTARAVREWVSTDRLQYSTSQVTGERWCLTSHAAGFIDPLFSRGLTNTLEIANSLSWRLLAALKADDFSPERFEYLERFQQGLLDLNDEVVYLSYVSFRDFHMWNAAYRVWGLAAVLGTAMLEQAYLKFLRSHDDAVFAALEDSPRIGIPLPRHPSLHAFLEEADVVATSVADGKMEPRAGGDRLFQLLREGDFVPPIFGFQNPAERFYCPSGSKALPTLWWSYRKTSPEVGRSIRSALRAFAQRTIMGD